MAEDRQVTPEKQLLNLIEGSGSSGPIEQAKLKRRGLGLVSPGSWLGAFFGRFSFFQRSAKKKIHVVSKFSINFVLINRVLVAAALALLVYVAVDTTASALSMKTPPNFAFQNEKALTHEATAAFPLKEEAYYLHKVTSRDLFREARPVEVKKKVVPAAASNVTKNLSLVGISWSANPDAIVEDKDRQKTYFVKRGQIIGDNIKVEAIFKDKVVLSHEGEEFELR